MTRYSAGSGRMGFGARKSAAAALRRAAKTGRRVVVHITVNDGGNKHIYDRPMRLAF